MADDQNAEPSRFWEVVDLASADVESWDEWKRTYAYAAYPESDFGSETMTVARERENNRD